MFFSAVKLGFKELFGHYKKVLSFLSLVFKDHRFTVPLQLFYPMGSQILGDAWIN